MPIKVAFLLLAFWVISYPTQAQRYRYVSTTDGHSHDVIVTKSTNRKGQRVLTLEEYKRYSQHVFHPTWGTERWELRDDKVGNDFVAQRDGGIIRIKGTFQHQPVDKQVEVDNDLWYNKLDHGLSDFATTDQPTLSFAALKLMADLDPINMEAEKKGTERIEMGAQSYRAVKVKLTLDHFVLSKLWSAYCWYRVSDGLFLRYQGANGRPGTPETVIELVEINPVE